MVSFLLRFFNTLNNKLRMKAERNGLKLIPEGLQGMPAHITSGNVNVNVNVAIERTNIHVLFT